MDLDDIGTGDVVFALQADSEDMDSIRSEPVRFVCYSSPPSHFPGWRPDNGSRWCGGKLTRR